MTAAYYKSYHILIVIPLKPGLYLCTTVKLDDDLRLYVARYLYTSVGNTHDDVVQFCLSRDALQVTSKELQDITTRAAYRHFIFQDNRWSFMEYNGTDDFIGAEAIFYFTRADIEEYLETIGHDKVIDNFTIEEGDIILNYNYNLFSVVYVNIVKELAPLQVDETNTILWTVYRNDPGSYIVTGDTLIDSAGEYLSSNDENKNRRFYISKDTFTANADTTPNYSKQYQVEVYRRGG